MFFCQPLAIRFGKILIGHIESDAWNRLDIAVAWVRASGMNHLEPALTAFLKAGNALNVIVGVDFENTTKEGLQALLSLQEHGAASIFVHHNEAGTIFHPKLYLFRSQERGLLIVGSNNVTEAGLFQNTEAGLELESAIDDPIIVSATNALDAWRDTSLGLSRELDSAFLAELVSNGYIKDEATMRAQEAAKQASSGSKSGGGRKLFGTVSVTPPPRPPSASKAPLGSPRGRKPPVAATGATTTPAPATTAGHTATGQVLLMRVRKAHVTNRPTQTQIPLKVAASPFFGGITMVNSVHSGNSHTVHPAKARGSINTLKLEIPEIRTMADPMVRFERTATGIQYEVYDGTTPQGRAIMQTLRDGLAMVPPTTTLTKPSSLPSSTWWRFI